MKDLFQRIHFSPKGSSDIVKEEATYMLFLDFLDGCEKVTSDPSIGMYCTLAGISPHANACTFKLLFCCCCCCCFCSTYKDCKQVIHLFHTCGSIKCEL